VKNHVHSILQKLGVRDRSRAMLKGIELGYFWRAWPARLSSRDSLARQGRAATFCPLWMRRGSRSRRRSSRWSAFRRSGW